jgi:hypothetical protein
MVVSTRKLITCGILLGNYAFKLLAGKFQGDPLFTHAAKNGGDQPMASTLRVGDG